MMKHEWLDGTNETRFQQLLIAFPFIYGLYISFLLLKDFITIAISLPL